MHRAMPVLLRLAFVDAAVGASLVARAEIYRYKDQDGHWVYTDQPPAGERTPIAVAIVPAEAPPRMDVEPRNASAGIAFVAINECRCPVEFGLRVGADDA